MATGEFGIFLVLCFFFFPFSSRQGGGGGGGVGRPVTDYPLGNPECLYPYSWMGFPIEVQE